MFSSIRHSVRCGTSARRGLFPTRARWLTGGLLLLTLLAGCARHQAEEPVDCDATRADVGPLLDVRFSDVSAANGIGGKWYAAQRWVERQLVPHDEWVALGWCEFHAGRITLAKRAFTVAVNRVRHSTDAAIGLGNVALREQQPGKAATIFASVLKRLPASTDARDGMRLALERMKTGDPAATRANEVLQDIAGTRHASPDLLYLRALATQRAGGVGEIRRRPDAAPGTPAYFARAGQDVLQVRDANGGWSPVFVKGVNIGPALPGRFASEAPRDEKTWTTWLDRIASLGANAVRVYTLQPPAFYRALAHHNAGPAGKRLWLLQGVWADLPPGDNFDDATYVAAFQRAIARAVDAVHGDLILAPGRGNARGVYDADVSQDTLAWIVGREWEPYAVVAFDGMSPGNCSYTGRFVAVHDGHAMECWIGRMLDYTAGYEARRYEQFRPLTFANWPTLDPLFHPTEATRAEEDALRHKLFGTPIPERSAPAWDDDAVSVDATLMSGASDFPPGVFASYHVYPNFPYFMNLEPGYGKVHDAEGVNRYLGYLRELKAYHGHQPVLIAEYGMSSSRGVAHLQPEGLDHGGHDERDAMRDDARLLRSIQAAGMAGGIAFEFMDEWFKGTWSTSPFEIPAEHRPRWFNAESPEQSYGLFANRPQAPVRLDGDAADWTGIPPLASDDAGGSGWGHLKSLSATYDAGWVYLMLQTAGRGLPDWSKVAYSIGLDTYAADRGERRLPVPADCTTASGVEFAVTLRGPGRSELLVTPPYRERNPAESGSALPTYSPLEPTGRWARPELETNRERFTRAGQRIPPESVYPGVLRFGSLDPDSPDFNTLADVATGPDGAIEIRLPWALLNFTDPSTGTVLDSPETGPAFGTAHTAGIRLYACVASPGTDATPAELPAGGTAAMMPIHGWQDPAYVFEPKYGLQQLQATIESMPDGPRPPATAAPEAHP